MILRSAVRHDLRSRRRRDFRSILAVVAVAGAVVISSAGPALAATAYGNWGYYGPYAGFSYKNQSYVSNSPWLVARSRVQVTAGGTAPTGYIGILPRLYKNTSLCAQPANYSYNGSPATGYDVPVYGKCGSGVYNSYGVTKAWTGTTYVAYYTFRSPNVNWPA
jgi:hypothetical protein